MALQEPTGLPVPMVLQDLKETQEQTETPEAKALPEPMEPQEQQDPPETQGLQAQRGKLGLVARRARKA
jgi:hypothetical protein